jgi:hypothetical protein
MAHANGWGALLKDLHSREPPTDFPAAAQPGGMSFDG